MLQENQELLPPNTLSEYQKIGAELSKDQAVQDSYVMMTDTLLALNEAGSAFEKDQAFKNSPLGKERTALEEEGDIFSDAERESLTQFNKMIAENQVLQTYLFGGAGWNGVLLDAIEAQLTAAGLSETQKETELGHYRGVFELSRQMFPGNFLLQMTALVHDSNKFDMSGAQQLALHELASVITGRELVGAALSKAVEIGIISPSEELGGNAAQLQESISTVQKLVARAIYSHGNGEFPERVSSGTPVLNQDYNVLYVLFGSQYYPKPNLRSAPSGEQPLDIVTQTTLAMNVADIFSGNEIHSFGKYNLAWQNDAFISNANQEAAEYSIRPIGEYITTHLFASYSGNFSNEAYVYYQKYGDQSTLDRMQKVIDEYDDTAFLFHALLADTDETKARFSPTDRALEKFQNAPDVLRSAAKELKNFIHFCCRTYKSFA